MTGADDDADGVARTPWIPGPRRAADDHADLTAPPEPEERGPEEHGPEEHGPEAYRPEEYGDETNGTDETEETPGVEPEPEVPVLSHGVLKSLLGAWALSACSAGETQAVEDHLTACAPCADEALRLRDAVALLHEDRDLDLDPLLRSRVLENCLGRRPARIPIPGWVTPYDAETARLDALLRDIGESEWHAPVRLKWYEEDRVVRRKATVAGVIGHLLAVDGLVSTALGLDDPLGAGTPELSPTERTEAFWSGLDRPANRSLREPWREQSHTLIRTVSFAGRGVADLTVTYKDFALPLRDSLLERAFECWVHAEDIAQAVAYPYAPPSGPHLHDMIDLAARLLPAALAGRRRSGLAAPARHLVAAGAPGRSLHLEVEGAGGGHWYIALDSPAAVGSPDHAVAQVAMDGVEFCQLMAGHVSPEEAAAGQDGDREAIRDVLSAAASLSRL
ncbi:maleylpyruvate isomerase N-terminal domain-containing protein [Streptomyces sp. NPDC058664]|uniref:maleylpyruvate isomerase N-terminal domain-containing protein n=1 Tax=unclassified Streptomyces TaxID=2593676 RepID=UPI00364E2D95